MIVMVQKQKAKLTGYFHIYVWGAAFYCARCHRRDYPKCTHARCSTTNEIDPNECDLTQCPHRACRQCGLRKGLHKMDCKA